jgi:hypothetical protein
MDWNAAASGLVFFQKVEYTIKGFDKAGALVHTGTFLAFDIVPLGAAPSITDTQDTMGIQAILDTWVTKDKVCSFTFQRTGDARIAPASAITIVAPNGTTRPYNPATDPSGMVFHVFKIDGVIITEGGETVIPGGGGTVSTPNIGKSVRFTGTAAYRAVWDEDVKTAVKWRWNILDGWYPDYNIKGSITWRQGVGGAAGAVGLPIFPEKPTFDVPTPWIDVTATTTRNTP